MDKLKNKIIGKLHRQDYDSACAFGDFTNLANDTTLRKAINELLKEDELAEISPDIFEVSAKSELIVAPIPQTNCSSVAYRITRQHNWDIRTEGYHALNFKSRADLLTARRDKVRYLRC